MHYVTRTCLGLAAATAALLPQIGCGGGLMKDTSNQLTYRAVEYTVTQPDGTHIVLRSRGSGYGTADAFFDVYIEDGLGNTTALLGDPAWVQYDGKSAAVASTLSASAGTKIGDMPSADANYWFDINGGADQSGVTYWIHTSGTAPSSRGDRPIHIDTEPGGNVIVNGVVVNTYGAVFWDGSRWASNNTYAHLYFTDLNTGERLLPETVTQIDAGVDTLGTVSAPSGYTVTKRLYTHTATKGAGGAGIADLGSTYPVEFHIRYFVAATIQDIVFTPAVASETGGTVKQ